MLASSTISPAHPAIAELLALLGESAVIHDPTQLAPYECDALTIPRGVPVAVVFPTSTEQVSATVKLLGRHKLAILPRGSGTGLAGGIVPIQPSVQVSTARMRRILNLDTRNRVARVEAGCPNQALSEALASTPFHFAPDPSSQRAATIGGNAATNAGGLHTLKYGVTNNHILGLQVVLADGSIHQVGAASGAGGGHTIGPDLTGLLCGSEGTLALITQVTCKLTPRPAAFRTALAMFSTTADACQAVSDIIAAGIIPAALEMMDGAMIQIVEAAFHFGFPMDAQSILLAEVDGPAPTGVPSGALDADLARIEALCRTNHARDFQHASDPDRRAELWSCRRRAFGAVGLASPSYCSQDACVPRSLLPAVQNRIAEICRGLSIRAGSVFHAGDGNLHPLLMYDPADPASLERALDASYQILRYCVSIGGTITGEHGVGIEKLPVMRDQFSAADLEFMHKVRVAFAPNDLMNPCKVVPREGVTIDIHHPQRSQR